MFDWVLNTLLKKALFHKYSTDLIFRKNHRKTPAMEAFFSVIENDSIAATVL